MAGEEIIVSLLSNNAYNISALYYQKYTYYIGIYTRIFRESFLTNLKVVISEY